MESPEGKSIAEEVATEGDDTFAWIQKSRKLEAEKKKKERELAKKRASMFDEFDEEAEGLDDVDPKLINRQFYMSKDLRGLKVGHNIENFTEGEHVLTLKDQRILDENCNLNDDDVLENLDVAEKEKIEVFSERKKKKPRYDVYSQFDKKQNILSQYDDEEAAPTFVIGKGMTEAERKQREVRRRLAAAKEKLKVDVSGKSSSTISDFKEGAFRKTKKRVKKERKRLTEEEGNEDLAALVEAGIVGEQEDETGDHGSRASGGLVKKARSSRLKVENEKQAAGYASAKKKAATLSKETYEGGKNDESEHGAVEGERNGVAKNFSAVQSSSSTTKSRAAEILAAKEAKRAANQAMEIDETYTGSALKELEEEEDLLYSALARSRSTRVTPAVDLSTIRRRVATTASDREAKIKKEGEGGGGLVYSETTEFVKNIRLNSARDSSASSTSTQAPKIKKENSKVQIKQEPLSDDEDGMNVEQMEMGGTVKTEENVEMEDGESNGFPDQGDNDDDAEEEEEDELAIARKEKEENELMKEQPLVKQGLLATLQFMKTTQVVEEKNFVGRKRDKSGELVNPTKDDRVRIEYRDEFGRVITPKEAWRHMSHKFHGKAPGKNKQEKRLKRYEEDVRQMHMSATDTPLNSVAALKKAQKKTSSPFIVIDGMGGISSSLAARRRPDGGFEDGSDSDSEGNEKPGRRSASSGQGEIVSSRRVEKEEKAKGNALQGKVKVEFGMAGAKRKRGMR